MLNITEAALMIKLFIYDWYISNLQTSLKFSQCKAFGRVRLILMDSWAVLNELNTTSEGDDYDQKRHPGRTSFIAAVAFADTLRLLSYKFTSCFTHRSACWSAIKRQSNTAVIKNIITHRLQTFHTVFAELKYHRLISSVEPLGLPPVSTYTISKALRSDKFNSRLMEWPEASSAVLHK